MDAWYEEDEQVFGHPHDPYSRIDILKSSRRVKVSRNGEVLAEASRPVMLFETGLPVRYYLPREDVRLDLLEPSKTASYCAYKGEATYWSHGGEDIAWTYERPLREAEPVHDLVCFWNEKTDVEIFKKIRACQIPPVADLRPDIPAALAAVLDVALDKDPQARFASATAFAHALSQVMKQAVGVDPQSALGNAVRELRAGYKPGAGDQSTTTFDVSDAEEVEEGSDDAPIELTKPKR